MHNTITVEDFLFNRYTSHVFAKYIVGGRDVSLPCYVLKVVFASEEKKATIDGARTSAADLLDSCRGRVIGTLIAYDSVSAGTDRPAEVSLRRTFSECNDSVDR